MPEGSVPDGGVLLNIALGVIATVATVIGTYFGWRQFRTPSPSEVVEVSDKIRIYLTRKRAVAAFAEMMGRAHESSRVYGQCRGCVDYPDSFFAAMAEVAGRGVTFRFIVSPGIDGLAFKSRVQGISGVEVKEKYIQHSRVLGIEGKEAIYVISAPNGYVGVHVRDVTAASHQQAAFEAEWE
ncbi:hypothetical protein ACH492_07400 [Streptomyces sp. NPDC019443]|uniref:hypothetical protein n=1 Tax=Streptomyces sp. NPDC019443 TaxID=3365061 RepID=UPI0037ABC728